MKNVRQHVSALWSGLVGERESGQVENNPPTSKGEMRRGAINLEIWKGSRMCYMRERYM
jgi:hypothetical protein